MFYVYITICCYYIYIVIYRKAYAFTLQGLRLTPYTPKTPWGTPQRFKTLIYIYIYAGLGNSNQMV